MYFKLIKILNQQHRVFSIFQSNCQIGIENYVVYKNVETKALRTV